MKTHLTIRKNNDFSHSRACMVNAHGMGKQSGPARFCRASRGLSNNAIVERHMPLTRTTPGIRPAQEFTDPLIVNARLVNLAAEIERNLAARRAMRPARSAAAAKGWRSRRDR